MQSYAQQKANGYSLAGNQLGPFERIVVSRSVDVPEPDVDVDAGEERVSYRAPAHAATRRRSIALPWAVLMIVCTVAIMGITSLQKAGRMQELRAELDQLSNKYIAAEQERVGLEAKYAEACDGTFISYYAAQHLKMKRALHEETIQVRAMDTRPPHMQNTWMSGAAGGY